MTGNFHTHTKRCKHASGSEQEYIEEALKKGFTSLGFSDHVPQPYPSYYVSPIRMSMSELPDYTECLQNLKDKYKDRINILIGYEVEYSTKYFSSLIKTIKKFPLDIYKKHMSHLIASSIDLKIPLEVNFLGFRQHRCYPRKEFFSLASSMNASFILGCDAHEPHQICNIEDIAGLNTFIEENNITYNQNLKLVL